MDENSTDDVETRIYKNRECFYSPDKVERYCDFYVIGKLWIETFKTGLLGSKWSLIPVVEAAVPLLPPQKPPLMRYKDLPLYQSPHYEYKDYIENQDKNKCPQRDVKLAQEAIYPYVRYFRQSIQQMCCEVSCELKSFKQEICSSLGSQKCKFKAYMRDPENLTIRQAVVTLGGLTGLYLGSSKGLPTKLFTTGLGLLATGALCFPKETDEAFRTFTHVSGKTAIYIYNFYCGKSFGLSGRVPCPEDMPPQEPVYRKPSPCPEKK